MTVYDYKNNCATTLNGNLTNVATSILVVSAAQFAPDGGKVTVATLSDASETVFEIVHVTSVSGSLVYLTRAQEGTTALAWPSGSKLQARLTAGMLDAMDPTKGVSGEVGAGEGSDANGSHAVAIGKDATATGGSSIAIGGDADAQNYASYAVVVGRTAVSNAQYGVVIGGSVTVDDLSTRVVSVGATNSITNSANALAIGSQITLSAATDSVVLGGGAGATDVRNVVVGKNASSAGADCVAVGYDSDIDATSDSAIAIGSGADITTSLAAINIGTTNTLSASDGAVVVGNGASAVTSAHSIAVGADADVDTAANGIAIGKGTNVNSGATNGVALGAYSLVEAAAANGVAVGSSALSEAAGTLALGYAAKARAANSASLTQGEAYAEGTITLGQLVPCIQRESALFWHQGMPNWLSTMPSALSSPPVDLAAGQVWATAAFQDNDVVFPTSPSGNEQFYLVMPDSVYDTLYSANNTVTEAGSQPTWVITDQGDATPCATVGSGNNWIYTNPMAGIDIAVDQPGGNGGGQVMFFPQKIGFICTKYVANTAKPFVSVGNTSSATAYVNNQQLTGITADNTVHWFPELTSVAGATNIIFTLVTKGTGASSRMLGRFIAQGVYMQLPG